MDKIREQLEKNKIFIDVFSSILLGVSVFLLSVMSYNMSKEALEYERLLDLPLIHIDSDRSVSQESISDIISIYNVRGKIELLNIKYTSYLNINSADLKAGTCILLDDYYDNLVKHKNRKNIIATLNRSQSGNFTDLWSLDPEEVKLYKPIYSNISVVTYFSVSYFNQIQENETVYYAYNYGNYQKLRKISLATYNSQSNSCQNNRKKVGDLKPDDLNNYLLSSIKKAN